MKKSEVLKIKEEIKAFRTVLKYIKKGYGKDKCTGYSPSCASCQSQILRGALLEHIDLLIWELK